MAVNPFYERIADYLFAPRKWASATKIVGLAPQKPETITGVSDGVLDLIAKSLTPQIEPPFFSSFANRLVLLTQEEWQQLALAAALLPYAGKIERSMYGYLRRAVRDVVDPLVVSQLEAIDLEVKPVFMGHWQDVSSVTNGAIAAVMDVCQWPSNVQEYTLLRFDHSLPVANIEQLNLEHVKALCKISLPNLSWLLS